MSTYDTAIPGADVYGQAELAAKTGYQNAVTRYNQQRQNTLSQYGYQGDIDPTSGALANVRVDPNNPFGQYQTLLRNSARESESAHDAAAGRGIGGGLAQQGETAAKLDFGSGSFALGTNLQNTLSGYDVSQQGANTDMNNTIMSSRMQALQAALQQQLIAAQNAQTEAIRNAGSSSGGGGGGSALPYSEPSAPTPGIDKVGTANVNSPTPPTYGITYGPTAGQRASSNKKQGVYTIH
jgi:hypothetical protein